jgi:WD40 repeat protein
VYLWDLNRRELGIALERAPNSEATSARCLAFTRDGSTLAAANIDGSVTMWNVASGTRGPTLKCT